MASEENRAPRHGRHAAAGRHAAPQHVAPEPAPENVAVRESVAEQEAVRPSAPSDMAPQASIPDLVSITDGDQETNTSDAPRPIGVDPRETGSFRRIDATEGARVTTRANASRTASFRAQNTRPTEAVRMSSAGRPKVEHRDVEVQSNKRVFIALTIGALVVIGIVGTLLFRALVSVEEAGEKPVVEQMQTNVDEGIEYRGTVYSLVEQDNGKFALTSLSEGSETPAVVCELKGIPVALVLYNTVFVIPENLPDGTWDLIAHPLGGGSMTQQVTDGEGKPIVREGEIVKASLSGDSILVITAAGEEFTVSLV